jgi:hypothetical protein
MRVRVCGLFLHRWREVGLGRAGLVGRLGRQRCPWSCLILSCTGWRFEGRCQLVLARRDRRLRNVERIEVVVVHISPYSQVPRGRRSRSRD